MPAVPAEEPKKNQHKTKHDAKEQRKPRHSRHQVAPEKKGRTDKKAEEPVIKKEAPVSPKPVPEGPGPEFYQGLKRETDDILKINDEANAKYKKKEIQSNWAKYEMPIESYEDVEELENMGADYEKLIQAPLSIGGHFQFKHEKAWDVTSTPSLYDKYFDINMENLSTSLSTIPFYERNSIDKSLFTETDISTMDNRSIRYKRKYYNDKSFTTPELESQDTILSNLKANSDTNVTSDKEEKRQRSVSECEDIDLEESSKLCETVDPKKENTPDELIQKANEVSLKETQKTAASFLCESKEIIDNEVKGATDTSKIDSNKLGKDLDDIDDILSEIAGGVKGGTHTEQAIEFEVKEIESEKFLAKAKNAAIESPEDLEKWLDDFLDD